MNRFGMLGLLVVALGAGLVAGAVQRLGAEAGLPQSGQADGIAGEASTTDLSQPKTSDASKPEPSGDPIPAFLADDESMDIQLRQLQIYYNQSAPESVWARHMPALLAQQTAANSAMPASMSGAGDDDPPYTQEELEDFREQLETFTRDLDWLLEVFPSEQTLDAHERLQGSLAVLPDLTDEQLAVMRSAFAEYPGYWQVPSQTRSTLESAGQTPFVMPDPGAGPTIPGLPGLAPLARPTVPVGIDVPDVNNCAEFADDPTCTDCPAEPAGGVITVFALETAALVTNTVCEFLPPKLLAGTTDIPNPANIICVSVRVGLELAAAAVKLAKDLHDECEDNFHRSIVHWYLDETVSSRASQKSHDFHNLWTLRVAIENDLLNQQDSRISLFQMPEANGGYLDSSTGVSVRGIVLDTIEMNEAAGYVEDTRFARDEYAAAEEHYNDGDFKSAYARYRLAYRAAVQVGRILPTPVP